MQKELLLQLSVNPWNLTDSERQSKWKRRGEVYVLAFAREFTQLVFNSLTKNLHYPIFCILISTEKILWPDTKASEGYARCNLAKKLPHIRYAATDPLPANSSASVSFMGKMGNLNLIY